jgi:hypothetical protein
MALSAVLCTTASANAAVGSAAVGATAWLRVPHAASAAWASPPPHLPQAQRWLTGKLCPSLCALRPRQRTEHGVVLGTRGLRSSRSSMDPASPSTPRQTGSAALREMREDPGTSSAPDANTVQVTVATRGLVNKEVCLQYS